MKSLVEIGKKIAALNLWETAAPYNWAVKPRGMAYPYFCTLLKPAKGLVGHLALLDGWQTFHDFVMTRCDNSFGFYSSPAELPHYAMLATAEGDVAFFRHDTGYMPRSTFSKAEEGLLSKILWEVYGVMMRFENEPQLAMTYAGENAIFARVEEADGQWSDRPLPIVQPRVHIERIAILKDDMKAAKDLPFAKDETVAVDFRIAPGMHTVEARPRTAYVFAGIDTATGRRLFKQVGSISPEGSLRDLWQNLAPRLLKVFMAQKRIPGEVQVVSQRTFRMLRPLCSELPLKLSLHDSIPALDAAFSARP